MNDKKEIMLFVNTIKDRACKQLDTPSDNRILEQEFSKQENRVSYIMSFSCNREDAAQWERYADNAKGVCIGFDESKMEDFAHILNCLYEPDNSGNETCGKHNIPIRWQRVYYKIPKHELVDELVNQIKKQSKTELDNLQQAVESTYASGSAYKSNSFKSENEKRLIITWPAGQENISFLATPDLIRKYFSIDWMKFLIKANAKRKYLVNFVEPFNYNEFITDIIIGPQSRQSPEVLKEYLEDAGYPLLAPKVKKSVCPIII